MSRRSSATLIGAFVVGALAILVGGLLLIGSGQWGAERETFVLYFRSSASGLKPGAPVVLKGVQIGVVTDIQVAYSDESRRFQVPVLIEIDEDRVQWPRELRGETGSREIYDKALQEGLRARLGMPSLVTGLSHVEIGFFPGTQLVLSHDESGYPQLPTISSSFDRLLGQVESLPLEGLVEQTLAILSGLEKLVNAEELPHMLAQLDNAASELAVASGALRARVQSSGDKLDATLDAVRSAAQGSSDRLEGLLSDLEQAVASLDRLARHADAEIGPLAESLREASHAAQTAFGAAQGAASDLSSAVGSGAPLQREGLSAVRAVADAARSLSELAEYLQRQPESLMWGKRHR